MSLRFIIGASGAGKSTYIYREIIERSIKEPSGKYFIIVPDQFTMQTQMDLVTMHEKKGIMNIDVLSFGRLTHRIFEELGGAERPMLDDTGKSLIIRKVAAGLKEEMPLIGGNLSKTGYVHEVKSALSEFMQYGVGLAELEELADFSQKRGQLYQKLKDLQVIYGGFLDYIHDKFLTVEESLEVLSSILPKSALMKDSVIVFDGFTGFTPVQNKVIERLLGLAKEVIVTITADGRAFPEGKAENPKRPVNEQDLFAMSSKMIFSLCKLAEEAQTQRGEDVVLAPKRIPRFAKSSALAHLERYLFRYPAKAFDGETKQLRILEASTQREEVRQICIAIRRLVREEGYCYRDIAVICGDFNAYASCMEQEFSAYDIPVYMDRTRGIVLNPFIEYIKSALQVRVQNYSYEAVFHYLRSGLADFVPEDVDRLEVYVRSLGIRGRKKWETMFVYRLEDMTDPVKELEELNALREKLVAQMEPLYGNYKKTEEFAAGLYRFIAENQVQQKLKRFEENFEATNDPVRAREYAQIYRLVMDLLDQIVSLIGEEASKPEEFAKILEAGFEEIQVGTIPQNVDRVVVGDMERTRLKQVKALFFAGVNDSYIPKNAGKGGIISDLDREFLSGSGKELAPTPRQQMYIQKFYLYLNMTKPSEGLVLSYARMSAEGKAMRQSFLIGQMQRLFPALFVEQPEKEPVLSQMQSLKDGREYLVSSLRSYADTTLPKEEERTFFTLYHLYHRDDVYRVWSGKLTDTAFFRYRESSLGRAVALALYGQTLQGSVSRLEQYAACAYAHFLRYGLKLKEQGEFSFEAVDLGNIFHGVLEIFAEKLKENHYTWFDFPKEEGERLIEEAVDAYAVTYHNTVLFDSARNAYMITRIKRILKRTVETMQYQLKKGSFVPEQFEVSFSVLEELDSVNIALSEHEKMRLRGRIDRMDVKEDEKHVYVKVMDYKSGSKDFSLAALYYGLQLQLVVYLNAAMEIAAKKHPDKEIVPAAMLYYRVQDPVIEAVSEEAGPEEINRQILKALRTTGVVNASENVVQGLDAAFTDRSDVVPVERKKDGSYSARASVMTEEDFKTVSDYVNQKIRQSGRQILDGRIALDPYTQGNQSACDFCAYKKVCGFDKKIDGFALRELENLPDDEAISRIREEVAHGDEVHT
ncbi:MAG: helicase-exonuclease AddAB subunit AddB [Eubacteriales bacterium]|nr:helicase-exonuclease AddAB subunit AddB [Eubacteriales bacterium]